MNIVWSATVWRGSGWRGRGRGPQRKPPVASAVRMGTGKRRGYIRLGRGRGGPSNCGGWYSRESMSGGPAAALSAATWAGDGSARGLLRVLRAARVGEARGALTRSGLAHRPSDPRRHSSATGAPQRAPTRLQGIPAQAAVALPNISAIISPREPWATTPVPRRRLSHPFCTFVLSIAAAVAISGLPTAAIDRGQIPARRRLSSPPHISLPSRLDTRRPIPRHGDPRRHRDAYWSLDALLNGSTRHDDGASQRGQAHARHKVPPCLRDALTEPHVVPDPRRPDSQLRGLPQSHGPCSRCARRSSLPPPL